MKLPILADLNRGNLDSLPCCGIKNQAHGGRMRKNCWLAPHFKRGLRAKVLLAPDGRQCGYIEYLPGEYAWRGVDAAGYLFIHCIWTYFRQYQHQGLGRTMIEASVQDARDAGMKGVAAVARNSPWLAKADLFLANGFEVVDTTPPDYQLLVRKLEPAAANPAFKGGWEKRLGKYAGEGLTIIRSDQCPHIAKFADDIIDAAEKDYGLKARVVELKSHRDAQQKAPTPYAVFAIIHNGRVVADHQISRTRFRNVMKKALAGGGGAGARNS